MRAPGRMVLVINAGSSSVKFSLFDMGDESEITNGIVERIGLENPRLAYSTANGGEREEAVSVKDHRDALGVIAGHVSREEFAPPKGRKAADAVGHRVVHGGERFSKPVVIDEEVKGIIRECFPLAPLHNPVNYRGIEACQELFPDVPHVAVFDTAFHQTLPKKAYMYAIPPELYRRHGIRRYGFHGTSHRYVSLEAARVLGKRPEELNLITSHLGNGCSITAVEKGRSVETSMGFTPLEGLMMGTRSGDIDPAVVFFLMRHEKMSADEVDELLNKKSGLLGLSGRSSDVRDVLQAADSGDEKAKLALEVFAHRIKKYIGAYAAILGRLDGLVFTAGIGENSGTIREMACEGLEGLGIVLDRAKNEANETFVNADSSKVKVMVVPTDEEIMIARDTLSVVENS